MIVAKVGWQNQMLVFICSDTVYLGLLNVIAIIIIFFGPLAQSRRLEDIISK